MRINIKQVLAIIFIFPFLLSLYIGFPITKNFPALILQTIVFVSTLYFFVRFVWLLGTSSGDEILFKESVIKNINKNYCPYCGSNQASNSFLEIGYRKRLWSDFVYKVYYIKYSTRMNELTTKIKICHSCEERYFLVSKYKLLSVFHINPSIKLLKRKYGYLRGIKFPFEKWNISRK